MHDLSKICDTVLAAAKAAGADKAYVSVSESEKREFNADGDRFSLMRTLFDNALSLTVIADGRRGSFGLNRLDDAAVEEIVPRAMEIARAGESDPAFDICREKYNESFTDGCPDCDTERLFDRTEELFSHISEDYPKIVVEQMIVEHDRVRRVYKNTSGTVFESLRGAYSFDVMFSAHDGTEATSFFSTGAVTDSLERPFCELGSVERDLSDVEAQLHPITPEGKFVGTVIMPPACLGSFVSDIIGNFASDTALLDGTSIWKDSLGQTVADERLTISLCPRDPEIICGERYSGDGFLSENYDFIRSGVLESFALSLYAANKTGNSRAKNASGALVIAPGDADLDSMIKGIERGLIVGRFSGGEPGASGDFSGVAKNSFLIENGKITGPVSEVMISGNLAQILKSVRDISRERIADGGSVLPYISFDGITVSGK